MAVATTVDPDWQFMVNQVTRILEKVGAESVYVERHTPRCPEGYVITAHTKDHIYEAAGFDLPHLTEQMRDRLAS